MSAASEHLSIAELEAELERARQLVEVGGEYYHYRNPKDKYTVTGLGIIEATQEVGVIYEKGSLRALTWIRPLSSWLEQVEYEGKMVPRFLRSVS